MIILSLSLMACDGSSKFDKWLGKWNGPEGTYLELGRAGDAFSVKIQNLDGPRIFDGVAVESGIEFKRDDSVEMIKAGSGEETGMKWLVDKKDCLVIKSGEGYCRD